MKAYPLPSCHGNCGQGDVPCKTEALCSMELHRYMPPITKEGGQTIEFEERRERPITPTVRDKDARDLGYWALWAGTVAVAIGVALLPFVLGAA